MADSTDWRDDVPCVGQTDLFFSSHPRGVAAARAVCDGCGGQKQCLEYALKNHQRQGVWGGESGRTRRIMQRRLRGPSQE